ncbi:MAG: Hsp20/alpha crystallin family protein [Rhodanobacteraceae bacterium]|nr:Hsp20/alpha crystallin family protein [Rhodanobacteraceae bacterium]
MARHGGPERRQDAEDGCGRPGRHAAGAGGAAGRQEGGHRGFSERQPADGQYAHQTGDDQGRKGKYQRREIYQGSFSRSITLPVNVDAGKGGAKFKDGMLELTFPKVETAKRRAIKIEG